MQGSKTTRTQRPRRMDSHDEDPLWEGMEAFDNASGDYSQSFGIVMGNLVSSFEHYKEEALEKMSSEEASAVSALAAASSEEIAPAPSSVEEGVKGGEGAGLLDSMQSLFSQFALANAGVEDDSPKLIEDAAMIAEMRQAVKKWYPGRGVMNVALKFNQTMTELESELSQEKVDAELSNAKEDVAAGGDAALVGATPTDVSDHIYNRNRKTDQEIEDDLRDEIIKSRRNYTSRFMRKINLIVKKLLQWTSKWSDKKKSKASYVALLQLKENLEDNIWLPSDAAIMRMANERPPESIRDNEDAVAAWQDEHRKRVEGLALEPHKEMMKEDHPLYSKYMYQRKLLKQFFLALQPFEHDLLFGAVDLWGRDEMNGLFIRVLRAVIPDVLEDFAEMIEDMSDDMLIDQAGDFNIQFWMNEPGVLTSKQRSQLASFIYSAYAYARKYLKKNPLPLPPDKEMLQYIDAQTGMALPGKEKEFKDALGKMMSRKNKNWGKQLQEKFGFPFNPQDLLDTVREMLKGQIPKGEGKKYSEKVRTMMSAAADVVADTLVGEDEDEEEEEGAGGGGGGAAAGKPE
jgi:hypothetical protein